MSDIPHAHDDRKGPTGMLGFTIVWFGQLVSMLGSTMTGFALTFWAWELTGTATALALVGFFSFAPALLVSPIAGALVDRWNRKLVMMLSDLAAGLSTIVVFLLYVTNNLEIWHLYVTGAFASVFQSFQWPAYSAAISTMIPKQHYTRANGMISMAESGSQILAPVLASLLLVTLGIKGVLVIDMVTFTFAIGSILFVHIPQPKASAAGKESKGSLLSESTYGFRYILARPSLLGLQLVFFCVNFVGSLGFTIMAAMVLARSGSDATALGTVQAAAGVGGVCGGLLLSLWGGPKKRVHGVLLGMVGVSLLGQMMMGVGRSTFVWAAASFMLMLIMPILNGSNQAIWQAKVPPDVQGRVFSVRRMIAQISAPLATLLAGPLADKVFEPAMQPGGSLSGLFGGLIGTGPGAGMGLLMFLSGALGVCVGLGGYAFRAVREAETLVPDHDQAAAPEAAPAPVQPLVGELATAE